jgi:hypothetical protein
VGSRRCWARRCGATARREGARKPSAHHHHRVGSPSKRGVTAAGDPAKAPSRRTLRPDPELAGSLHFAYPCVTGTGTQRPQLSRAARGRHPTPPRSAGPHALTCRKVPTAAPLRAGRAADAPEKADHEPRLVAHRALAHLRHDVLSRRHPVYLAVGREVFARQGASAESILAYSRWMTANINRSYEVTVVDDDDLLARSGTDLEKDSAPVEAPTLTEQQREHWLAAAQQLVDRMQASRRAH